jgi:TP901 family phage tail tape measure protein
MAEVKFKFVGDDSELRKKLANLAKMQADISNNFKSTLSKGGTNAVSEAIKQVGIDAAAAAKEAEALSRIASNSAIRDAKLAEIAALRKLREERSKEISDLNALRQIESEARTMLAEKKLVVESLVQSEKKLNIEYLQSGKTLNDYNLKLKESAENRRIATEEQRKADKVLRDNEKARKDADREEAKRQKELEKRKKLLEQESSEYYKLNKALGAIRKSSKEVLAEMFRMELQGHKNTAGYEALRKKSEGLVQQTQLLDKGIKKIDATLGLHQRNVGNYSEALEVMSPQIASINQKLQLFGTSLDDLSGKPGAIKELGASFVTMGKGILTFLVSPIGMAIALIGSFFMLFQRNKQTVIDFDSGLLNVSKTTGLAGMELKSLSDEIIQLSRALKTVSTNKLLEYATVAGQLGVKGAQDILAFSESLAKLETASDISGEEGGAEIARLLTLVDGGVQNVKAFGDEIVNLGNNFAASEKEILSNAEAISQNVGLYKVGRQDVLGYAAATKALGMEAEVVGSTFQKTLGSFEKSIRSGKGVADILKVVGGSAADLQKRFRTDASGVFQDYIKGLNGIFKAGGSVQAQMEKNGITDVRQTRVIGTLAAGYDKLTEAMDTAKNATGAMDAEFETASGKLVNQSARIGIAWDNMVLSIENGSGAIGVASVAVVGFFADILEGITNVVTSNSWGEFFTRINPTSWGRGSEINDAMGLNKTFQEISDFNKKINKMGDGSNAWIRTEFSNMTKQEFEKAYKAAKENSEKMAKASLEYQAGVLSGRLKETDDTVNEYKKQESIARLHLSRMEQIRSKKGYDFSGKPLTKNAESQEESEKDRLKREKAEAAAARKSERIVENARKATERQRSLQLEIDKINETASRNQLTRDQSEVESVKDKYAKIREEVRKFYDDPKNKGKKVDTSGLLASEKFEVSEVETKAGTKLLVESLSKQKQLLDEYNAFASQTSKEEADKRYENELGAFQGYKDRLIKEYMDIIALQTTAENASFSGTAIKLTQAQEERAKVLKELIASFDKEEKDRENSKYIEFLNRFKGYEIKRQKVIKDSEKAIAEFKKRNDQEGVKQAEFERDQDLNELFASQIESSKDYQQALKIIEDSTAVMLGNSYRHGKEVVLKLIDGLTNATEDQKGELRKIFGKFFDQGAKDADLGKLENIASASKGFASLANNAVEFAGGLSEGLKTLQSMVDSAAQLSSTFASLSKDKNTQNALMSAGAGLGMFGAGLSVISSITGLFSKKQDEANEKRQRDIAYQNDRQLKSTEAVTKMLQKQLELMNNIYGVERLEKYSKSLQEIVGNYDDLNSQLNKRFLLTGDQFTDGILERLNNGESQKQIIKSYKSNQGYDLAKTITIFNHLDKYAKANSLPSLTENLGKAKEQLAQLQYQAALGNADEYTMKLIDQLSNQVDLYQETLNKLKEENTGNSLSSILSDLTDLFFNSGLDSADAWSKGFDKVMKNYAIQKLSRDYLDKAAQEWYDLFDELAKDGITDSERNSLKDAWDKIQKDGQKRVDELGNIIGNDSSTGLSGAVKRELTEATASELTGLYRSTYDLMKRSFQESTAQGLTLSKQLDIANSSLTALNAIQSNTANTVERLDTAVKHLDQLVKNTSQQSNRAYTG